MKKTSWTWAVVAGGSLLCAYAPTALAQDPNAQKKQPSDGDQAVQTLPTWESYGSNDPQTMEETFFRLSRDFVSTAELGVRRLGMVPIWPRGQLKFGPIRILPYVREAVEYESNFFKQPNTGTTGEAGRHNQVTHVNEAGFFADTALCGGRARISASADWIYNLRYQHNIANSYEYDNQLGVYYRWPIGMWVAAGVALERRTDPLDFDNSSKVNNNFDRQNRRGFVNFGLDRDIFFGTKAKFEIGMATKNVQSETRAIPDLPRTETEFHAKVSYPFWKDTTRVFVQGRYRIDQRNSERINDGAVGGMDFGIEGSIPLAEGDYRGLRGQVSVGFDEGVYDNQSFLIGSKTVLADPNRRHGSLHSQVGLQYLMSTRSTIDLRYLRDNQFSFKGNYQIVDRVDLTFSHNLTRALTGRIAAYYQHTAPSGLTPNVVVGAATNPPPERTQNSNEEGLGIGFRYAFNDFMDFDMSFDVTNRVSTQRSTYKDYRGILGVTFYLNAITPSHRSGPPK